MFIHFTAIISHMMKLLGEPPQGLHWEFAGFDEDHNIEFEMVSDNEENIK